MKNSRKPRRNLARKDLLGKSLHSLSLKESLRDSLYESISTLRRTSLYIPLYWASLYNSLVSLRSLIYDSLWSLEDIHYEQ